MEAFKRGSLALNITKSSPIVVKLVIDSGKESAIICVEMAKILRLRDKLLLGAALTGDLLFEIEYLQPLSFQMKKMRGVLPPDYKLTNFYTAVSKMLKTGYLEKIIKNGEPYLRISGKGKKILIRDFPLFSLRKKKWDGLWRIVFYDIPEKQRSIRENLEAKLKELGFGMVQESVYLSPLDVAEDLREFILAKGLGDKVFVSVSKQLFAGNTKNLANKVWRLEKINDQYEELYQKMLKGGKLSEIFSEYEEILRRDPCLPKELLPEEWFGDRVQRGIKIFLQKIGQT